MRAALEFCSRFFETRIATAEDELRQVHRTRYEVYCRESAYFDPREFPDGLERDVYDVHSVQSLLIFRPDVAPVGAVRLILPPRDLRGSDPLPFDHVCERDTIPDKERLPWESTAELSRFCVTSDLGSRVVRTLREQGEDGVDGNDVARQAKLWLMRGLLEMSVKSQVTHWCAVIGPRFLNTLLCLGVHLKPFGPLVDYYGQRQPCHAEISELLVRLKQERREVWDVVTDDGRWTPGSRP
ncbi:MAG: PEP-CTERM/exosortase system-associated acyltransferase [Myxococcota bacterium]